LSREQILQKIKDRKARVGVVGLGYVGSALTRNVCAAGFAAVGIDPFLDARPPELEGIDGLEMSKDFSPVSDCDVIAICVPTPLTENDVPDLSAVTSAVVGVAGALGAGSAGGLERLVVLESTTYPGTTREMVLPELEAQGQEEGRDFFLAYAPERVDPGRDTSKIPRVVGGIGKDATDLACAFYEALGSLVHPVETPEAAEMSKLLENVFRAVNIALVNEMSLLCRRMDIDIWEVVEAAATKPFGFMSFKPGPGMGGHCIPVDPFYLSWRARQFDFYPEFIELAGKINRNMPWHVVEWVGDALGTAGKGINGSRVLVVGVAYKEDVSDVRESPALKVIEILEKKGALVVYHDTFVPQIEVAGNDHSSVPLSGETLGSCDCILLMTAHSDLPAGLISEAGVPVVDTRNALGRHGV
jgi:UDP-N-acetyl-D-glucosamine dehydrogenase